jgi:hypothetical protein
VSPCFRAVAVGEISARTGGKFPARNPTLLFFVAVFPSRTIAVAGTVADALAAGTPAENVINFPSSAERSVPVIAKIGFPLAAITLIFLFLFLISVFDFSFSAFQLFSFCLQTVPGSAAAPYSARRYRSTGF